MLTKEQFQRLNGNFTWDFGKEFFIETSQGNFIWSDPDYGGDNSIRKTNKTYNVWITEKLGDNGYGRDKGQHYIDDYCGTEFSFYL